LFDHSRRTIRNRAPFVRPRVTYDRATLIGTKAYAVKHHDKLTVAHETWCGVPRAHGLPKGADGIA
jgi:hypothetical protein